MLPPLLALAPQLAGQLRAGRNFLIVHSGLLVCILFLLGGLALAGDYGINYDERAQRQIAQANWDYIRGQADRIDTELYHDRVYGVVLELPLLLVEQVLGLSDYYHVHRFRLTLTHLLFIIGAFFCYRLAYRLTGQRLVALLALLLFLLHPRIYAHSYLNSKDLPFLSMFMVALYLLERAFRRDTPGAFLLLGVAIGILTNIRIMGIGLLAATLALRGLDLWGAGGGAERKSILQTAGLFLVAAGLTLYAITPYAWANPVDYLTTSLGLAVNHPVVLPQLFQGQVLLSNALPPHYAAVRFGISTPPLVLLLGFIGTAAVAAWCLRRPGMIFRQGRRRFLLLLAACFLLPPLAASLLGSNQYEGWRQIYFVYAPFCLLAALGSGWLAAALSRRRHWPAGMYGLAGLGLGLILLQMAQIHPLQTDYFNFLVDRASPERLRTQYAMDYWKLAAQGGLDYLRESYPGESLTVRTGRRQLNILPAAARQYIAADTVDRNADYALAGLPEPYQPDLAFNSPYRQRLYNNTLSAARPLDWSRMTPAAIAAYWDIYRQATAGEPVIRADYAVYIDGRRLTFVRENCPPDEPDVWFGVKPIPPAAETLPPYFPQPGFYAPWHNQRVRLAGVCLAVIQLPAAVDGDLLLLRRSGGNYERGGLTLWSGLHSLSQPGLRELIARGQQQRQPADDDFAVFLDRDGGRNRLLYAKAYCSPAEYATPLFLHIYPARPEDLPPAARAVNFENRDFALDTYGGRPGGECLAVVPLPDYPIVEVRTGQAGIWHDRFYPSANFDRLPAEYGALAGQEPDARAAFDLYRRDNRLLYRRESCAETDTAAGFFLHITPEDRTDLPRERRDYGFANRDFAFAWWGGSFGGQCLATVPLPDFPIAVIRTGQAGIWQRNLYPPADPDYLRAAAAALSGRLPVAHADFDLYLQDNRLIYLRESCAAADVASDFFLHIIPRDTADLPQERRREGYANLDFVFERWGGRFDGKCLAAVPLPEYPIAAIRTGQGGIWETNLYPPAGSDYLRAAYAALSDIQPVAQSDFELYRRDNQLVYLRESCAAGDTAAGFFLHIVPVDVADLPAERQAAGFANGDFVFERWGGHFDGKCLAAVALPEYPIAAMRTGQYVPGQGELWAAELAGGG